MLRFEEQNIEIEKKKKKEKEFQGGL